MAIFCYYVLGEKYYPTVIMNYMILKSLKKPLFTKKKQLAWRSWANALIRMIDTSFQKNKNS